MKTLPPERKAVSMCESPKSPKTMLLAAAGVMIGIGGLGHMGVQILRELGVRSMRLMSNNPRKLVGIEGYGLSVSEWLPIEIAASEGTRETEGEEGDAFAGAGWEAS